MMSADKKRAQQTRRIKEPLSKIILRHMQKVVASVR